MSLELRIRLAGSQLGRISRRLADLGYQFEEPSAVFPGPEEDAEPAIEQIEREVGALPLALKIFWRQIGSVNFMGGHSEWRGCDYADPIVIYPPSMAIEELEQFLNDKEERMRCNYPYVVPIGPDAKHKADVSGGMFYNMSVPAIADDPPLNDEPHGVTFVQYLELAIRWGGFPGLENADHNWPLAAILGE